MSRQMAQQRGFTLIEVLIVSTLFLVVLGATLGSFTAFERNTSQSTKVSDQVEIARTSMDRASRQLRNLARRIDVPVIHRASSDDLVFQTSAPEKRWMRYCLQTTAPSSSGRARLYALESSNSAITSPTDAMLTGCPGTGWTKTQMAADYVANASRTPAEPVFRYQCTPGAPVGCPRATALAEDSSRLKQVGVSLGIDLDPAQPPKAMKVASSVFLRNQNEPPVASFTWTSLGGGKVLLNGSSSTDPEGRTLRFYFFKGTVAAGTVPTANFCSALPAETFTYYTGVAPTYTFPASESAAMFTLVVCDAGDLKHTSAPQEVRP